uniref:uncharacterized protein LOC105352316 n=1 Tax=Fragaria vesca subsp. vesca TaxID=101020 RepID=UPI0005CAC8F3|nr:PREDICTED: uncharacterized protein LOC105352316 [Fragaria vesca subsp. vesca]
MKPAMTSLPYTAAAPSDPFAWNSIPHKRLKPPTAPQDPAKKPKLNITEKPDDVLDRVRDAVIVRIPDDVLSRMHLTREDVKLSRAERMNKMVLGFKQELAEQDLPEEIEFDKPKYGPDDTLPKGYDWASLCEGTGHKDYIVHMECSICHVSLDHCPKRKGKGTDE